MSKKDRMQGIRIPFDLADQVTLVSLKEHRGYLKKDLKQWNKNPRTDDNPGGYWLHPDDVVKHATLIKQMDAIIEYYGG